MAAGPPDATALLRVMSPVDGARPKTDEPEEDQDLILARALQEQEHAFMLLHGFPGESSYDDYSSYAGSPALGAGPGSGAALGTSAGSDRTFARMRRAAGSAAASPGGEEEELEGDEGEGGEEEVEYEMEEELDDEALARRLHEQDQRELYQRMLEMSGYHTMTQADAEEEDHMDGMTYENLQALGDMAGVVSRGLSEAAIQKLPQMTLSQLQQQPGKQQRASDEAEACGGGASAAEPHRCTICLVDLEEDDLLKVLPCSHAYHSECLDTWLGINKACPVCVTEVPAEPAEMQA